MSGLGLQLSSLVDHLNINCFSLSSLVMSQLSSLNNFIPLSATSFTTLNCRIVSLSCLLFSFSIHFSDGRGKRESLIFRHDSSVIVCWVAKLPRQDTSFSAIGSPLIFLSAGFEFIPSTVLPYICTINWSENSDRHISLI